MRLDGQEYAVQKGDLILNRPNGTHGVMNDGEHWLMILVMQVAVTT